MQVHRLPHATEMQRRAHDAYRPGETTQQQVAQKFGVSQSAISHRLRRMRLRLGLTMPRRRTRIVAPMKLMNLTDAHPDQEGIE